MRGVLASDFVIRVLFELRVSSFGLPWYLCVLFTAHDAHMRHFKLTVLSDCCAAESDYDHNVALSQLKTFCNTRIARSDRIKL